MTPEAIMRTALTEIARLRTDLRGDFSMGSRQSDIARKALSAIGSSPAEQSVLARDTEKSSPPKPTGDSA